MIEDSVEIEIVTPVLIKIDLFIFNALFPRFAEMLRADFWAIHNAVAKQARDAMLKGYQ